MAEFIATAALLALVVKLVEFLQALRARNWNTAVTLPIVWVGGTGAVLLFAASDWGAAVTFGDLAVADMNIASLVIAGFAIGSSAAVGYDTLPIPNRGNLVGEQPAGFIPRAVEIGRGYVSFGSSHFPTTLTNDPPVE